MFTEWAKDDSFLHATRVGVFGGGARLADLIPDKQTRVALHFCGAIRIFETIHREVEDRFDVHGPVTQVPASQATPAEEN